MHYSNPFGNCPPQQTVDMLLGKSYHVVKAVYLHLKSITVISEYIEELIKVAEVADTIVDDINTLKELVDKLGPILDISNEIINISNNIEAINTVAELLESIPNIPETVEKILETGEYVKDFAEGTPRIVESIGDVYNSKTDGYFWVKNFNDPEHPEYGNLTIPLWNRSVKATGSTKYRILEDRFADVINVRDYGAKGDGITDDTEAIAKAFNNANEKVVYFPIGKYLASSINMTSGCHMDNGAKLFFIGADKSTAFINCSSNSASFGNIYIDANNKQISNVFQLNGNKNFIENIFIENLSSTDVLTCGLVVYGEENTINNTTIRNFINSGYWNDSSPQGVTIDTVATKNTFNSIIGYSTRSTVVDNSTGINFFGNISSFDCQDNGFYGVNSGTSIINCINYEGTNNAAGFRHEHVSNIGSILTTNRCAVFFGDCGNIKIGEIIATNVKTIITTNEANTGDISIGRIDAKLTDGYPIYFPSENGNVSSLTINELNIDITVTGESDSFSRHSFIRLDGCAGVKLNSVKIIVHYLQDLENQHLYIKFNESLSKNSFLGRIRAKCLNSLGSLADAAIFVQNCWQEKLTVLTGIVQGDYLTISSDSNLADEILISNSVPTSGYWKQGKVLWKASANGTNAAFVCTESGTPGKWAAIPVFSTDSTFNTLKANSFYPIANFYPKEDNVVSVGTNSNRFSTIFAATGSINTSDIRCKQNITNPTDKLLKAWGNVNYKLFQFNDAIKKKGINARLHIGVIAQEVQEAFANQGLNAANYGLFCYDEWLDQYETIIINEEKELFTDDGKTIKQIIPREQQKKTISAGNRYGIRYEEALALECAYLRNELSKIKTVLANKGISLEN